MSDYLPKVLPDELLAEILWRLPIKSIIDCRCVSKSWNSLIKSCYFIKNQLLRSPQKNNPQIFLNMDKFVETANCLLLFDKQDYFNSMEIQFPTQYPPCGTKIINSVNGLICFSIGSQQGGMNFAQGGMNFAANFIIFNPLIGHFQSISSPCPPPPPSPLGYNVVKGFGFDELTQDYNILYITGRAGFIYSLNLNRWRSIRSPLPNDGDWEMKLYSVLYLNGKFHWIVRAPRRPGSHKLFNFIMVFDLKSESFGRIPLPRCLAKSPSFICHNLTEYGESSIAFTHVTDEYQGNVHHVWMMEQYGSAESWIKLIVGKPYYSWEEYQNDNYFFVGFRNKYEVFIERANGSCLLSQKIKKNNNKKRKLKLEEEEEEEVKKMMDLDQNALMYFTVHKYVPSLVLLDKENNIDVAAPTHTKRIKKAV